MTRHGKFEAVALLRRSGRVSVWSARPAGSTTAAPNHCLKRVELSDHDLADHDPTAAENLLVGAALQQAMADKSGAWAPVYELGSDGTDAFYVTKLYPRSAQSMIDGRARLTSAELRTLLLGVVDGLLDLHHLYGRPHANLKPSNVLLGEQLRPGQIALADPGAAPDAVPSLTRAPDPKAVGQLLYALVTHRPHTGARWPLPHADGWRALGTTGRPWLQLCESLLAPRGSGDPLPDLEQMRARVQAIQPTPRRVPRALVALPLLAAVAGAAYLGREPLGRLYQSADRRVAGLTPPPKLDRKPIAVPAVQPAVAPVPQSGSAARSAAAGSAASAVLGGYTVAPSESPSDPPPASTARPAEVPPVVTRPPPPPSGHTPPLLAAPAAGPTAAPTPPAPAPATTGPTANAQANQRALDLVRDWSSPDFKSDAAQQAFEDGRRAFVKAHDHDDAAATLGQWEGVSTRLRLAGDAYPPVDPAATAGWPAAVADQVAARREQVLARAVAGAFDQTPFDPAGYRKLTDAVRSTVAAAALARKALAGGSLPAARSAVDDYQAGVRQVAGLDPAVADALSAAAADLNRLATTDAATDRPPLLATADDEQAPLAVRVDAWQRAARLPDAKPWPADFAAAAADHARGADLVGLLHDQDSPAAEHDAAAENDRRLAAFLSALHDPAAVAANAAAAGDPQYADLLAKCPAWFRFDAALAAARRTPADAIRPGQRQQLIDLATAADVPSAAAVAGLLRAGDRRSVGSLADAGPASTGAWRLHPGATADRCTFDATDGTRLSLEFLRVRAAAASDAGPIDCFASATGRAGRRRRPPARRRPIRPGRGTRPQRSPRRPTPARSRGASPPTRPSRSWSTSTATAARSSSPRRPNCRYNG